MHADDLRRRARYCERLASGAIPYTIALELRRLATELDAEAAAQEMNEDAAQRAEAARRGN